MARANNRVAEFWLDYWTRASGGVFQAKVNATTQPNKDSLRQTIQQE
jgi:hypothetical protein